MRLRTALPILALRLSCLLVLLQATASAQISSVTTLTTSPGTANYGQAVTLQATVTAGATGKVTFYDGAAVLGTSTISGASASLTTVLLQSGHRLLRAYYLGDGTYAPSSSSTVSETVVAGASLGLRHPVNSAIPNSATAVAGGDFNGDRKVDLATTGGAGVNILLGNGDGSFQSAVTYSAGSTPYGIAVGDFDGDGKQDLALTNGYTSSVSILMGNGDGTFQTAVSYLVGSNPEGIAIGDFDADGIPDLAVTNYYGASLSVLLGRGDGTFGNAVNYSVAPSSYPTRVSVGDLNGDGKADLVAATYTGMVVLTGQGDGTFGAAAYHSAGYYGSTILGLGDFNGDGYLDIAIIPFSGNSILIFLGSQNGTLGTPANYITSFNSVGLAIEDLNGDGKLDLALVNSYSATVPDLQTLTGGGDGTFQGLVNYSIGFYPTAITVGDFNGDGIADVAAAVPAAGGGYAISVLPGGAVPDVAVTETHDGFTQGQSGAVETITVTNAGEAPTVGGVGVIATVPAGFAVTSIGGTGWTCVVNTLVCTRADPLGSGASYAPIRITVNISANLTGNVTSSATVSGGGELNGANNTATDPGFVRFGTATALSVSPNPAVLGHAVTLTASVTSGATGSVAFYDGTSIVGVATLSGTQANLVTYLLSSGTRSLQARYLGDSTYGPSISAPQTATVAPVAENGMYPFTSYKVGNQVFRIAADDFDGDGKIDLAMLSGTNPMAVSIMRGNGDGTFQPAVNTPFTPYNTPNMLVTGDFNRDGKPDVAVGESYGYLYVLLGNGDGTFQAAVRYGGSTTGYSFLIASDFDRNGTQDLVVLNYGIPLVLLGNGDGTFQPPVAVVNNANYSMLAVADMNGDGKPDLICTNGSYGGQVSVILGNGDGTFQSPAGYAGMSAYPSAMVVGDFNGDSKVDVAFTYWAGIAFLPGNGDGSLGAVVTSSLSQGTPADLVALAGDFNGDGKLDIAFPGYYSSQIVIAFGNGDGTFQPVAIELTEYTPGNLVQGDFNRDGRPDFAAGISGGTVNVFVGGQFSGLNLSLTHTGTFTAGQAYTYQVVVSNPGFASSSGMVSVTDTLPAGLTAASISGTGWDCTLNTRTCTRADTLSSSSTYPAISIVVNVAANMPASTVNNTASVLYGGILNTTSDPTVIVLSTDTVLGSSPNPSTLGHPVTLTAMVSAGSTGTVEFFDGSVFLGTATLANSQTTLTTGLIGSGGRMLRAIYSGDSTHGSSISNVLSQNVMASLASGLVAGNTYTTGTAPWMMAAGEFNGDGKTDLVTANSGANTVSVLLGNGDGSFAVHVDYDVGTKPVAVAVGDFNSDGKPDLAVANQTSSNVSILFGNGDGTFQTAVNTPVLNGVATLATGDLNNDGKADLLIGNTTNGRVTIFLGNGDATFRTVISSIYSYDFPVVLADFNGDGKTDVAYVWGDLSVFLGNGDGTFQSSYFGGSSAYGLAITDLNSDGKVDVITVDGSSGANVFLGKGDGTFLTAVHYNTGSSPQGVASADVNGDGKPDVIVVNNSGNSIGVLLGAGNGTLQSTQTYPAGSQPRTIVVGEFNGDGRTDLAVMNSGSNSVSLLLGVLTPVLGITSSHNMGFALGQTGATYTVTVSNYGPGPTFGTVTMTDTLPLGLTATAIAGNGWSCTLATLTCTRPDSLAEAASYPAITVTVNVSPSAPPSVTNIVGVTGGNAIPAAGIDVTAISSVILSVGSTPLGNFTQGQTGATFALTVSNVAGNATSGTVTVVETVPNGMTLVSLAGSGWTCPAGGNSCTRGDALSQGSSYAPITATVNISAIAPAQVINHAMVSGGGSPSFTSSDSMTIHGNPLQLVALAPCRVIDTRNPNGPHGGPYLAGGVARTIQIASTCGVPANAAAYSLNITVSPRKPTLGYLTVWPAGQPQPVVSTLNSLDGSVLANGAVVPAGSAGSINAFATDDTELIIDINGYFVPPASGTLQFYPVTPCRVADTRYPTGSFGGPAITGGTSRSFPISSSSCGVPSGAAAYALNVTVAPRGSLGYLTAWPSGQPQPVVSTLNSLDGTVLANAAIVPAGTNGAVSFYATDTTDLIVDINGYFAPPASGGLNFYAVSPCRVVDTRDLNNGTFGGPYLSAGTTRAFPLSQGACGLPSATAAYSLNMTVVPSGSLGYLTSWPVGASQPTVSTLNALKGQVAANAALIPAGINGAINVFATDTTQLIVDTNGYFGQ